jgi:hypothetical protein
LAFVTTVVALPTEVTLPVKFALVITVVALPIDVTPPVRLALVTTVVALPTDVTMPVKLAFVVTLPAVKPDAVPVMFVPTKEEGVPSAGVTSVGDVANTVAGAQRESGQGAGTGSEPGTVSDKALAQQLQLAREMGVNIPGLYLTNNYQILQKYKDAEKTRQMQLNQQNAQLQGQLQQQIIAGQLASGAQQQAGATTRDILTSNPYQASVLNTGGLRNI